MHADQLLTTTILLLAVSAVGIIVSRRAGFGSILGLLAAGILLGPHTPGPVVDIGQLRSMTELGVVFLLFVIGLELEPRRLWAMRRMLVGLGSLQMIVTGAALMMVATVLGRPWRASLILGLGLALSSTALVGQLLAERGELTSEHGRACLAILLLQDMAIVPLIALVPLLGPGGSNMTSGPVIGRLAMVLTALAVVGVLGHVLLPRSLAMVARRRNMEAFAVLAVLAVMVAAWATHQAGLSPALGGFVMGVLLSKSPFRHQIAAEVAPYKGVLLGLFFISVGMSIDVGLFFASWAHILLVVAALILLKGALLFALCRLFGLGLAPAVRTSLLMTQGGEFGFVLFSEAVASGVMEPQLHTTALLVISISMACTSLLARLGDRLAEDSERPLRRAASMPMDLADHVLIAGYGRVGQAVSNILEQADVSCLAIDVDPARIAVGQAGGHRAVYGDACEPHLLEQVGAGRAAALIIALDRPDAAARVISAARSLNPTLPIIARAHDLAGRDLLERLGAHEVVLDTLALSMQLGEAALLRIGVDEPVQRRAVEAVRRQHTRADG
jgi:glutathione-regulated potassium-efflux system protein KefB